MSRRVRRSGAKWLQNLSLAGAALVAGRSHRDCRGRQRGVSGNALVRRTIDRDLVDAARLAGTIGRRYPCASGRSRSTRSTFGTRCTTLSRPIPVLDESRSSKPTRRATFACSPALNRRTRRSPGSRGASHRDGGARERSQQHGGDVRLAGTASRDLCRGGRRLVWRVCSRPARTDCVSHSGSRSRPSLLVTILVHLTVRQLVGQPLDAILRTMAETAGGDLRARTTMTRRDELGTIAAETERDARPVGAIQSIASGAH